MRSGLLRVAIGPLEPNDTDDWPVVGHEGLREHGYEVVPFCLNGEPVPDAPVRIIWSPEYLDLPGDGDYLLEGDAYKVGVVGDWHITDPDVTGFDMVTGDRRYVRTHPDVGALWWRQFSFDPRLHTSDGAGARDLDWAFMGRPRAGRTELMDGLYGEWCRRQPASRFFHTESQYDRGYEATIYRRSKIVVHHSARGELAMRLYEGAACGALVVSQHDTEEEIHASGAPIPTYDPAMLPDFLGAWLTDDKARAAMVARQQEWVQQETPQRHLRWLLDRVRERMPEQAKETRHAVVGLGGAADTAVGGAGGGVALGQVAAGDPPLEQQRRECADLVPASARRVLDWGCDQGGFGWHLQQLAPGRHVVGLDGNERALRVAGQRLASSGDAFDFDGEWPVGLDWRITGFWDCLTFLDVLEHLSLPGRLLRRARSLLKPDGCVVASIPNVRNLANLYALVARGEFRYFRAGRDEFRGPHDNVLSAGHIRLFTKDSIAAMFEAAGYRIERWEQSRLTAPGMERWHNDVAWLIECHGGDAEGWKRDEATTIQHIVVARPDWSVAVTADEGVL